MSEEKPIPLTEEFKEKIEIDINKLLYEQSISWDTEALIELSKILDLKVEYIMIIEEDYDLIFEDAEKGKYRIENKRIISRIAKNNLEDIVNKLIDLYKEYTKKEDNRRGCFYIEGVELAETTNGITLSTENIVAIRFNYGT